MLQTAASVMREEAPQADALRGQPEYPMSGDGPSGGMKRRPVNRKRKRRPHIPIEDNAEEASMPHNSMPPYWRTRNEDNNDYMPSSSPAAPEPIHEMRHSSQTTVRRRKPPAIREPLAALEKEQKLYELRNNKPEKSTIGIAAPAAGATNSENLKNILKNSGGMSLSEILQQKNLSLDDLLKGKQNALQALQTTATSPAQKLGNSRFAAKPKFSGNTKWKPSDENTNESESKERSKLTALQKLKLFGSSSRPSGSQVGLADHLTTRKREGPLYTTNTLSTSSTTTAATTTRIPLYKKILHQRSTLKPTLMLKNTHVMPSIEPTQQPDMMWDNEGEDELEEEVPEVTEEPEEEQENEYPEQSTTTQPETTTVEEEEETTTTTKPMIFPTFSTTPRTPLASTTTTASGLTKTNGLHNQPKELSTSTRRMYTSTRGFGRTTFRFSTSSSTPASSSKTSTTTTTTTTTTATPTAAPPTTTTQTPTTTTTTTSTTTASSSTMNLTPKANLNLNTENIRERIQETLLKNLIEKEDNFRKPTSTSAAVDNDDDLENFFEESVKPKTAKPFETSTITTRMKQYSSSLNPPKPTQNANVIPDFDNVDDRTDLLELIEDRRSGNRLFKVLEQRNMTLEELIEHRKRGSSQLHLATIVQSPSRFYPDKKVVLQDNMDIVTAFENFPHFNLLNLKSVKPDEIKTDSQGSSYFTSIIDIEPTDEVYTSGKIVAAAAAGKSPLIEDKVAFIPDRSDKSLSFFPSWKSLALASLATTGSTHKDPITSEKLTRPFYLPLPKILLESPSDEEDYEIKENELMLINEETQDDEGDDEETPEDTNDTNDYHAQAAPIQAAVRVANEGTAHDLVDLELSGHGFKRSPVAAGALAGHKYNNFYANMPAGIRSAIVASATIVLTALVTFMVIFAVFRWKQKRHHATNIIKSYNAMKSKLPTIATTSTAASALAGLTSTRHSSLRDMSSLMGGSGLSVNATITTTTTGVPNTPSPAASQTTIALNTTGLSPPPPPLTPSSGPSSCGLQRHSSGTCASKTFQLQHQQYQQQQQLQQQQQQHLHNQHLQRHSSLLIQRLPCNGDNSTNLSILSNCNLADLKRSSDLRGSTTSLSFSLTSGHNNINNGSSIIPLNTTATTTNNQSQSNSSSCHNNSSSSKNHHNPPKGQTATKPTHSLNTMDANSPEVQEYLFDTLRNSF